jgi:hypothetical protein
LIAKYGSSVKVNVEVQRERLLELDNSIMVATLSRRVTKSGKYIGLGLVDAKYGDALFILDGGKTPFVLRALDINPAHDGTRYEVVGDCYMHGLMDFIAPSSIRDRLGTVTLI